MRRSFDIGLLIIVGVSALSSQAWAQAARLPIAEGVWVKTDTTCGAASNVYVYKGNKFGSVYFYGPNQSMGPSNETEVISKVSRGQNGFTIINEGPIEVASRPNGPAVVRAVSLSEGVQWTETVRLCTPATLSAKLRTALTRLSLL